MDEWILISVSTLGTTQQKGNESVMMKRSSWWNDYALFHRVTPQQYPKIIFVFARGSSVNEKVFALRSSSSSSV
jgi:hypothetical protein